MARFGDVRTRARYGFSERFGMRDRLFISLCNLPEPARTCLLVLDSDGHVRTVDLGHATSDIKSGLGLTRLGNTLYLVYSSSETRLAALHVQSLELLEDTPLREASDAHAICVHGGLLHVVSTGTDEVLCYDLDHHRAVFRDRVWSPTGAGRDVHHINGLAEIDGELWCSAIGPKEGLLWSEARNGYIHNITKDQTVSNHLWHPHSLLGWRGQLYFCDSSRSRVITLGGCVVAETGGGYVRGLAIRRNQVFVGTSIGRRRSKSTGVHNPADPGEPSGTCSVRRFDLETGSLTRTFDLSPFGTEVYDVLAFG